LADVYISVNNVTNLYALDVQLTFNPALLEVVDENPGTSTVEIAPYVDPGLGFTSDFVVRNVVNNFTGSIWFAATQLNPAPPRSGSGRIAHIRFRGRAVGTSAIGISSIQLADRDGLSMMVSSTTGGSVTVASSATPVLAILYKNTTQVRLTWSSVTGAGRYFLYPSSTPYFDTPDTEAGDYATLTESYTPVPTDTPSSTETPYELPPIYDDTVLGNTVTNYFYTLRTECSTGGVSAAANEVGKFEYSLRETASTDYSWVALPLSADGVVRASSLAANIEAHSNRALSVLTVSQFNPVTQKMETCIHSSNDFGNFNVSTRMPYRIEVDISGISSGEAIWALVGSVPPIILNPYVLRQTASTDYTWVMQPLELGSVTTAHDLALNIEGKSSAAITVLTITRWNNTNQQAGTYVRSGDFGDFATRFGYPYRVEVNIPTGSAVSWPARP